MFKDFMERRQEHINDGDNSMSWTEEDTGQRRILWTTLATFVSINQNKTENCSTIRKKRGSWLHSVHEVCLRKLLVHVLEFAK